MWQLLVNGAAVASGDLPGNGTVTRTNPTKINEASMSLAAGDTIQLIATENGGADGAGDFIGTDLKVSVSAN